MKSCPTCNRTFDDTLTFCLVDGSILSAPFDPRATQHHPASRKTDPAPTEIMYPTPPAAGSIQPPQSEEPLPPAQTVASPALIPSLQETTALPGAPEYSSSQGVASNPVLETMKAPVPEVIASGSPRGAFAETPLPAQTRSAGGKRVAVIAVGILAVIVIVAVVWLIQRAKNRTTSPGTSESRPAKQAANNPPPTGQSFTENIGGADIRMVSVPGGAFLMGSPRSETGRDEDEGPQSNVTVPTFYMGKYEVTQAQYKAVMGTNPSSFKGDDLPVDSVSWTDAVEFCRKLSSMTGRDYRLPTEAEWEFACRAGTTGASTGDLDAMTWYRANSGSRTHPVGQKQPNGFGLYDMNGNVWEWCQSKYKPYPYKADDGREDVQVTDVRVMRGGSWESTASSSRSAYRRRVIPDVRSIGFRIALAAR